MKFTPAEQRLVMDYAASALEKILILHGGYFLPKYIWRIERAIKLLRNPPIKKTRRMRG